MNNTLFKKKKKKKNPLMLSFPAKGPYYKIWREEIWMTPKPFLAKWFFTRYKSSTILLQI